MLNEITYYCLHLFRQVYAFVIFYGARVCSFIFIFFFVEEADVKRY